MKKGIVERVDFPQVDLVRPIVPEAWTAGSRGLAQIPCASQTMAVTRARRGFPLPIQILLPRRNHVDFRE